MVGNLVTLPLGLALYTKFSIETIFDLYFVVFDQNVTFDDWIWGPDRRDFVGQFIFILNFILGLVPGLNSFSAFILGYWANLDYYDYKYDLYKGPIG